MEKADALSRRADQKGVENDNKDIVLLNPEWIRRLAGEAILMEGDVLLERIQRETAYDPSVMAVLKKEKHLHPYWKQEGNLIFKAGLVVVLINPEIRKEVLYMHHDNQVSGHPGRFRTLELIT
jgi:hypothetical protein